MRPRTRLTVKEIAQRCAISAGTVSRVLNNEPGVKEPTRKKVMDLVERFDYNPFQNVPIIKKIRQRTIRAVLPYGGQHMFTDQFYMKGLDAVRQVTLEHGFELSFVTGHDFKKDALSAAGLSKQINSAMGIMFFCPHQGWDDEIERVRNWGVPLALVNRPTKRKNVIAVREKRAEALDKAVAYLAGKGYRNVQGIGYALDYLHHYDYLQEACARHGLSLTLTEQRALEADRGVGLAIEELVAENRLPEVFMASTDTVGMLTIKHLHRLGLRVPDDVGVMSYDNVAMATYIHPELTTVNNPIDSMASHAARLLIEQAENGKREGIEMLFDNELIVRGSC